MKYALALPLMIALTASTMTLAQSKSNKTATPAATGQAAQPNREAMAAMHRKMSDLHKQVADCLASTRPVSECQQQMKSACSEMMSKGGMGTNGGMMGQGMGGMMEGGMMGMSGCPMMGGQGGTSSTPESKQPAK